MTAVAETSREALSKISGTRAALITDAIFRAVEEAERAGTDGASMREIKEALAKRNMDVDMSTISGRVAELIKVKRLKRKTEKRMCSVSHQCIGPLVVTPLSERIGGRLA